MAEILLVDREEVSADGAKHSLQEDGYHVVFAQTVSQAREHLEERMFALVVLNETLEEQLPFAEEILREYDVPIIVIADSEDIDFRLEAFDIGADDVLTTPYHPRELVARVRAILRRAKAPRRKTPKPAIMEHEKFEIHTRSHRVFWAGTEIELTKTEFRILIALIDRAGTVVRREELTREAYQTTTAVSEQTIDSHVYRLRRKLLDAGCDALETVRGVGFRVR